MYTTPPLAVLIWRCHRREFSRNNNRSTATACDIAWKHNTAPPALRCLCHEARANPPKTSYRSSPLLIKLEACRRRRRRRCRARLWRCNARNEKLPQKKQLLSLRLNSPTNIAAHQERIFFTNMERIREIVVRSILLIEVVTCGNLVWYKRCPGRTRWQSRTERERGRGSGM